MNTRTRTRTRSSPSTLIRQGGLYTEEEQTIHPHQCCILEARLGHWPPRRGRMRGWIGKGRKRQIRETPRHLGAGSDECGAMKMNSSLPGCDSHT